MQDVVGAVPVRQGDRDDLVHRAAQDKPQLPDTLGVGAVPLPDGDVAALQAAVPLDATGDRDAGLAEEAGGGFRLAAALRLPHAAEDRPAVRDDDRVVRVDRIEAGAGVARQEGDLRPRPAQQIDETLVLQDGPVEVGRGGEAQVAPLRLDLPPVDEGVLRVLEEEAPYRRDFGLAADVGHATRLPEDCGGPTWIRTRDQLIMSQLLLPG